MFDYILLALILLCAVTAGAWAILACVAFWCLLFDEIRDAWRERRKK